MRFRRADTTVTTTVVVQDASTAPIENRTFTTVLAQYAWRSSYDSTSPGSSLTTASSGLSGRESLVTYLRTDTAASGSTLPTWSMTLAAGLLAAAPSEKGASSSRRSNWLSAARSSHRLHRTAGIAPRSAPRRQERRADICREGHPSRFVLRCCPMPDNWLSDTRTSYDTVRREGAWLAGRESLSTREPGVVRRVGARFWGRARRRRRLRAGLRHPPPPWPRRGRVRHRPLARDDRHRETRLPRPPVRGGDDDRPRPDGRLSHRRTRLLVRDPRARSLSARCVRAIPSSAAPGRSAASGLSCR